jgi:hypothetical protein
VDGCRAASFGQFGEHVGELTKAARIAFDEQCVARFEIAKDLGELDAKLGRLEHAFIYERAIDESRYRPQRDKLREEIALAKMEATEAAQVERDIDGLLAFADHVLKHASAIWTSAASTEERIKFQWTIVPTGCKWSPSLGTFEGPISCLEFFELQPTRSQYEKVVDLTGIEPVTS